MTGAPSSGPDPGPGNARWRRVNELFHQARERPPDEREAFLQESCAGDGRLLEDVRSLVAAHETADGFLDSPPAPVQIGHYRIDRVLGQGGMGIVYLADDTRLGRRVALKAVPPAYTHDRVRRDRLRREARAAAALTHPGIATIYALEEFGDDMFIATEYVPGETLRDELTRGAGTPLLVLETAIALAGALAAAHDGGVIHRDLKPENVMRTAGGGVKILDFGLAQTTAEGPDIARPTEDGRILGTPAYMAPEQIRRETLDARTDLFGFGILVYELTTGKHPFRGSDSGETIARILESEPALISEPLDSADVRLRRELVSIARTCMAKSPAGRFSSAHAVLAALRLVRDGGTWRDPAGRVEGTVMRWWQFHQAATCATYAALMFPLWRTRGFIGGRPGLLVFVVGLAAAVAACVVRLHLWFAASSLPEEWRVQREHSQAWLRTSESLLVAVLAIGGFGALETSPVIGAILVSAAVAVLVSFTVIEPATTRAAFRRF